MTKTEVYNNIRYNENLVYTYQNTIRGFDNQINNLNNQIGRLHAEINNLNAHSANLRNQIGELERLREKCRTLQNNFANKQNKRKNSLGKMFSQIRTVNFISTYVNGMDNLLSGDEYKRAYNGISAAIETITNKIHNLQNNNNYVENEIWSKRNAVNARQDEIRYYQRQKAETNEKLAYRKRRITYWKGQLRYAT